MDLTNHKLPTDLAQSLYKRNHKGNDYDAYRMDFAKLTLDKRIRVSDKVVDDFWASKGAKGFFQCFAPGYSKDRRTATVKAWVGPDMHGIAATYMLRYIAGFWCVDWREFAGRE